MKRTLALILALVMTMALVACGGDKPTSSKPVTPDKPATSTPATPDKPTEPSKPTEPEKPVDPDAWKYGGDLILGTGNAWSVIDPHQTTGSVGDVLNAIHIFENLAVLDDNGKFYGRVMDIEESADGKTVKFTLRERYFSNGKKITIDDVVASLERAAALQTSSNWDKLWKGTSMKVEGNTITFTMDTYNINFLNSLCSNGSCYKVMPKEICDKYPVTGGEKQSNGLIKGGTAEKIMDHKELIGSGTYVMTAYTEEEITFTRNEKYELLENDAVGIAAPAHQYLDTITVQLNKDAGSRTAATLVGDYHIGSITSEMWPTALTSGVKKLDQGTTWTMGIFFNLHESNADSPVANVNVRKAIRVALDCNAALLAVVKGDQSRVFLEPYPIVKSSAAYASTKMEDSGEYNVKNIELAKEYLKKANYNGEKIVYLTNTGSDIYNCAMAVVPQLEAIGLNIELMVVDSGSHSALRKDPKTGHDIGGWQVQKRTDNPVLHSTFVTGTQGWWSSPAKDAAIEIMKTTPTNSPESVAAYNDYLDAVIEECPYILFGHVGGILAYRDNVEKGSVGSVYYYYWNDYFLDNKK